MVLPDSSRVSRAPPYSGIRFESVWFSPTWLSHPLAELSSSLRLTNGLVTLLSRTLQPRALHAVQGEWRVASSVSHSPLTIRHSPRCTPCSTRFGLFRFRSPLLSESRLFSLPPGTEMVHFPGFAFPAYEFSGELPVFNRQGFPIRKSPDQCLLAAPRGLSQLATSFIACLRQGIHRTPLVA